MNARTFKNKDSQDMAKLTGQTHARIIEDLTVLVDKDSLPSYVTAKVTKRPVRTYQLTTELALRLAGQYRKTKHDTLDYMYRVAGQAR